MHEEIMHQTAVSCQEYSNEDSISMKQEEDLLQYNSVESEEDSLIDIVPHIDLMFIQCWCKHHMIKHI